MQSPNMDGQPLSRSDGPERSEISAPHAEPSDLFASGTHLGRYILLEVIGSGGMGVVYAAYDPQLDRKVALKLLKHSKLHNLDKAQARLRREAKALARLNHVNVVTIHEVAEHHGRMFVAMEFIEGQTLGAWSSVPRPWREVREVFLAAGRGLAAAHAEGITHRDFKPDNVMLSADGRVRVMDFGLAHSHATEQDELRETGSDRRGGAESEEPRLTRTGAYVGTPAYMAPEQYLRREVGPHSDQFAFCVALHEALCGARPFSGDTFRKLFDNVVFGAPSPAPADAKVPQWLMRVVARGLANDAKDRYPSMDALLDALAADPRRRALRFASGGLAAGALAAAVWAGASLGGGADTAVACEGFETRLEGIWDSRSRTAIQAAIEGTKLSYAAETWTHVERGLDNYTQRWISARESACEATQSGEQSGELLDRRMACLDHCLVAVRATVDVLATTDKTTLANGIQVVTSLPRLERCAETEALLAEVPPPDDPVLAERVSRLDEELIAAKAMFAAGKYAEGFIRATPVVEEAKILGHGPLQVRAWLTQGELSVELDEHEDAMATFTQAYKLAVALRMVPEAAQATNQLMYVSGVELTRFEEARAWSEDAQAWAQAVGSEIARGHYLSRRGTVARAEGLYDEARDDIERALAIYEIAFGPQDAEVATLLNTIGGVLYDLDECVQARPYFSRAIEIHEALFGSKHPRLGLMLNNLAMVSTCAAEATGDPHTLAQARGDFEHALAILEPQLGPEHPNVAGVLMNYGLLETGSGNPQRAQEYYERALTIFVRELGREHMAVMLVLSNLGNLARNGGDDVRARDYYEQALAAGEAALGPDHPDVAEVLSELGDVERRAGAHAAERVLFERVLAIHTARPGSPGDFARAHYTLARALRDSEPNRDERERAHRLAEQARDLYKADGRPDNAAEIQAWIDTWDGPAVPLP